MCRRSDIPAERGLPVRVGELNLALFDLGDRVVAVENCCRHLGNPIDDGFVSGGRLTCPWHGWRYDLRTGEHLSFIGRRPGLRSFPVCIEGSDVLVELSG